MVADNKVLDHASQYNVFPKKTRTLVAALQRTYDEEEYDILSDDTADVCEIRSLVGDGSIPICVFTLADRETVEGWFSVYTDLDHVSSFLRAMDIWNKYGVDVVGRVGVYVTDIRISNLGDTPSAALFLDNAFYFENEADAVTFSMRHA